jgi:hypothetical protein
VTALAPNAHGTKRAETMHRQTLTDAHRFVFSHHRHHHRNEMSEGELNAMKAEHDYSPDVDVLLPQCEASVKAFPSVRV